MSKRRDVAWDRRRSRKNIHVGKVSVFFRGASWHIYYREDGKARRVRIGPDRKAAEKRAAEVNAELSHEVPSAFGFERVTVEELVRMWLEHHELVLRSSVATVRRYRSALEHLLGFVRERRPGLTVDALNPRTAESFVKRLRRTPVSPNGHPKTKKRPLRDKGVVFVLGTCRSLFNYAARQRHLPPYARNPFSDLGIERMKIEDAKPTGVLTEIEEAAFLAACDAWQFGVFFTMAFTGLRPGELCHLLVEDVDLQARILHVRNRPELGWKTKTRNERRIFLFDELLDVVRRAAGDRACGPLFLAPRFSRGESLPPLAGRDLRALVQELGRRVAEASEPDGSATPRATAAKIARGLWRDMGATTPKRLRQEFMRITKRIGRPDLTCPKVFRHGMATAMQAAGVDPFVRKEIIGHTRLETTGIYTHTAEATLGREMTKAARTRERSLELARARLQAVADAS
ncbi:MAG: tyrosine-type recombinase/integrase [Planctomycetota bacterium]|jgi:integrase